MTRTVGVCSACGARVFRVVHLKTDQVVLVDEKPVAGGTLLLTASTTAYGDEIVAEFKPGSGDAYQPHSLTCAANAAARERAARVELVAAYLSNGMSRRHPITIDWDQLELTAGELVDIVTGAAA